MAVVTRSTTRKSRYQTANPDYKVKLAPRATPKAAPKAASKVAPKAVIKAAPKAAKKADFKAPMKTALKVPRKPSKCKGRKADVVTPEDIAAREAKEAETAERVVSIGFQRVIPASHTRYSVATGKPLWLSDPLASSWPARISHLPITLIHPIVCMVGSSSLHI